MPIAMMFADDDDDEEEDEEDEDADKDNDTGGDAAACEHEEEDGDGGDAAAVVVGVAVAVVLVVVVGSSSKIVVSFVFPCWFWDTHWVTFAHQDTLAFRLHGPKPQAVPRIRFAGNAPLLLLLLAALTTHSYPHEVVIHPVLTAGAAGWGKPWQQILWDAEEAWIPDIRGCSL